MSRAVPFLLALALAAVALPAIGSSASNSYQYIVGHDPEDTDVVRTAIELAGGRAVRTSQELGFTVATTNDPSTFLRVMSLTPEVEYTETDDVTRLSGAQWNGAQWNGAQWNGAQWNGAQWNGAQWNGAQWNDANLKDVSVDQRQAAKWTEKHYQAESTNKMRWAGDLTDPGLVWQWGHWAADANHAWTAGHTGSRSASLCVLDSGVAWDHPDIKPNYVAGYNAMNASRSAYDDGGHGTHIAGIAAASLADGFGVAGVANVQILNAKVLDQNGAGHESDLAFGLVWCAQQDAEVAVMALSVTDSTHPTLVRAIEFAAQRDVLLLASAGNDGGAVSYPARDPNVIAVSAVDGGLGLASFSNRGAEIELAAPGVSMLGPLPGGLFAFGSGTSQAVGYAAGVAALVRDADGDLTAAQARAVLASSAADLGAPGKDASFGAGLVDVDRAVQQALAP